MRELNLQQPQSSKATSSRPSFVFTKKKNSLIQTTWWKTRPNPHGPYYYHENWEATDKINAFLTSYMETLDQAGKDRVTEEMKRCQAISKSPKKKKKVQTVGKTSLEDLMASLDKHKGNRQG